MLIKQHGLLAAISMTPRAAPPPAPNKPATSLSVPPPPVMFESFDFTGQQLDPGVQQAFDETGMPILRDPTGKQMSAEGKEVVAATPRFNSSGQQLDPFNRPLPPGAVPMFTKDGAAIGVGPDAKHYTPDGNEVPVDAAHYDADGKELPKPVVAAANAVSGDIAVAIKVREKLKGDNSGNEAVDALGRTFRESKDSKSGTLLNADGQEVPLASARGVQKGTGLLGAYEAPKVADSKTTLTVKMEENGEPKTVGEVEIKPSTSLQEVRRMIGTDLDVPNFVFLQNYIELLKYEERDKLAASFDGEIFIRGKELAPVKATFTRKTSKMMEYEQEKEQEKSEFDQIFARVRQGKFLRNTKTLEA
jgi:hypothetical protein